ncbi:Uncharacterised protein [Vibrio cholerae]|nr:Uncharacterised protein [Vibrio cholerae]
MITILSFTRLRSGCNRITSGCSFDHNLVTITVYATKGITYLLSIDDACRRIAILILFL